MNIRLSLLFLLTLPAVALAAPALDGGVISTSRSTNSQGFTIKVWADGHALLSRQGSPDKAVSLDASLAVKFLNDAKAARANPGEISHCMKSASFGTTTTVLWHEWQSPDLQCPPFSSSVGSLARETRAIQAAADVGMPMNAMPLPIEQRRVEPSPSMSPTV